jgi:hypothetical protein
MTSTKTDEREVEGEVVVSSGSRRRRRSVAAVRKNKGTIPTLKRVMPQPTIPVVFGPCQSNKKPKGKVASNLPLHRR